MRHVERLEKRLGQRNMTIEKLTGTLTAPHG